MFDLPAAARTAGWLNAWLAGRSSSDDTVDGLLGDDGAVEFAGPEPGTRRSPGLLLGELRRWRIERVLCALPVAGDPLGLAGPSDFNVDALEVGQAVLFVGGGLGAAPLRAGTITTWRLQAAEPPPYLPSVGDADRELRAELLTAAERLARLDVASWRPDVADLLVDLRQRGDFPHPYRFAVGRATGLLHDALRARTIVALARDDDGGAVSAAAARMRADALDPLERAGRRALVAAVSSLDGR